MINLNENQAIKLLEETFSNDFDMKRFQKFTKELFNHINIKEKSVPLRKEYVDYVESVTSLGVYRDPNNDVMEVFAVKLKRTSSMSRARTMQRNLIARYLRQFNRQGSLVAFYGENQDWRLSFVKMDYQLIKDDSGNLKVKEELTPAKRYSFLVGKNEPSHTCKSQFLEQIQVENVDPTLKQIEDIFSVEKVTKDFFSKYKELFWDLKDSIEAIIKNDNIVREEFEEKKISTGDFAKKLMGQIVFIYFLQKKGWLGVEKGGEWGTGPKNFIRKLFNGEIVKYNNFFNDLLEPLFYEALASERDDNYYRLFDCKIPFLNGGLFEPINSYNWVKTDLTIEDSVFEEIFDTFDTFNFTVKEDEPLEKEVAVDPEMLGKVFEKLLEVKDRKFKGAFYTPREIVHYMCQQSLINYLETNSDVPIEDLETFIQLGDFALDSLIKEQEQLKKYNKSYEKPILPQSIRENCDELDDLLENIKVVDPAVGSGAFPVGMMNEIMRARSILAVFSGTESTSYDLKRKIIEKCLYGADIDSSAVDITKLRFWLSLIVDETDIHNIKPLPNLDHKIMCGNSLMDEFEGIKLFDEKLLGTPKNPSAKIEVVNRDITSLKEELKLIRDDKTQIARAEEIDEELKKLRRKKKRLIASEDDDDIQSGLYEDESKKRLRKLKKLHKDFFNERGSQQKKELRNKIERMEWELIEETLKENGNEHAIEKLKDYKKNNSKPFFLWKLYFADVFQSENPGFDVVIANPPYISYYSNTGHQLSETEKKYFVREYDSIFKEDERINSMNLFVEKGLNLLKKNGYLTYITNKTLAVLPSYKFVRKFILNKTEIDFLVTDLDPFEAIVDCIIFGLKNVHNEDYKLKIFSDQIINYDLISVSNFIENSNYELHYSKNYDIIKKIEEAPNKLSDILTINRGMNIGGCSKEFLSNKKINSQYLKYISGTKSLDKYFYEWNSKYDCYAIFDAQKEKKLKNEGYTLALGNHDRYLSEKLFIPESGQYLIATLVDEPIYSAYGIMVGTSKSSIYDLKYICALINSKLFTFYALEKNILRKGKKATPHVGVRGLNSIPVFKLSKDEQEPFIGLVNKILSLTRSEDFKINSQKRMEKQSLESKIDNLIYRLYHLEENEIEIVNNY